MPGEGIRRADRHSTYVAVKTWVKHNHVKFEIIFPVYTNISNENNPLNNS